MTTQTWLIICAFIGMVVLTQLGWRKYTIRNFIQPFALTGVIGFMYIRSIPLAPADVIALGLCGAIGMVFGLLMLMSVKVRRDTDGRVYIFSGLLYLLLWLCALGMRVMFANFAQYWYPQQFYQFMVSHNVSFSVIAPAFIFMTITMILVRSIGLTMRVRVTRQTQFSQGIAEAQAPSTENKGEVDL